VPVVGKSIGGFISQIGGYSPVSIFFLINSDKSRSCCSTGTHSAFFVIFRPQVIVRYYLPNSFPRIGDRVPG
jgi:hypothetical protein